jgi:hypothetical protein
MTFTRTTKDGKGQENCCAVSIQSGRDAQAATVDVAKYPEARSRLTTPKMGCLRVARLQPKPSRLSLLLAPYQTSL